MWSTFAISLFSSFLLFSEAEALTCNVGRTTCGALGNTTAWANCNSTTLSGSNALGTREAYVRDVPVHVAANFTTYTSVNLDRYIATTIGNWSTNWVSGGALAPYPSGANNATLTFPAAGLYLFAANVRTPGWGVSVSTFFAPTSSPTAYQGYRDVPAGLARALLLTVDNIAYIQVAANESWMLQGLWATSTCASPNPCSWYVRRLLT